MYTIMIVSLLACLGIYTLFLNYQHKKTKRNHLEYFLCNRNMGFLTLTFTFLATQLGGGVILGCSEAAYLQGWSAMIYAIGLGAGLLALALGIGARFRKMEVETIPEIFTRYYHSRVLRIFASLILIISMFLILIALGVATRKVFFAIGFHHEWFFIAFWCVVIFYTSLGGLNSVVKTDLIQILFVLTAFVITFFAILYNPTLDLEHLWIIATTPSSTHALPWIDWLLMPMLFVIIGQDMGQRCFAAKTPFSVSMATLLASLLLIVSSLLPVFLGILAREYDLPISGASILIQLVEQLTHPLIGAFFAGALLMAILSTADSLLCAISLNITCDLFENFTSKHKQTMGKIMTFLVGLSAMLASFSTFDIIPIMILGYELTLTLLLIPILMAVFSNKPQYYAALAAMITGLICFVGFRLIPVEFAKSLVAILLSLLSYVLVKSLLHDVKAQS